MKIKQTREIWQEAVFLQEKKIDHDMVRVLSGDVKGTPAQWRRIKQFQKQLKEDFYLEVMYVLTHVLIKNGRRARFLFEKIVQHKESISVKMERNVGVEVATLDYLHNVARVLERPQIIEREKILGFARLVI
ncbi:MAG: hypothetical protein HQL21_09605 [Candidatus Omnitrophica bacterium]|nr:hypothetical protein [Candidatus Omnitrophota bacterium]